MDEEISMAPVPQANTTLDHIQEAIVLLLSPIILLILILNVISNCINIIMLAKTVGRLTSLNIFLFNISCFNLLMVFNDLLLFILVVRKGEPIPPQVCHVASFMNTISTKGLSLTHFALSWDRYIAYKSPLRWRVHRKKAGINTSLIWIGVSLFAVYGLIFSYKDINGDIQTCIWPAVSTCNLTYSIALSVLDLGGLLITGILVYILHTHTRLLLTKHEERKQHYLKETFHVTPEKIPKSVPERAILSLLVVFTVHFVSQLPSSLFNVIRHAIVESDQNIPVLVHVIVSCINSITGFSPLFLLLNNRYKQNVSKVFPCICKNKDKELEKRLEIHTKLSALTNAKSNNIPQTPSVFISDTGANNTSLLHSISVNRANKYVTKTKMPTENKPNRHKTSVALEAVNTGLVLAAAGHGVEVDNFFKESSQGTDLGFDNTPPLEVIFL